MTTCPACAEHTITTPDGRHLTAQPTRLGLHHTDGRHLTPSEIAQRVRTTGNAGHAPHTCAPAQQGALFDTTEAM
jgi:hypothetical protein